METITLLRYWNDLIEIKYLKLKKDFQVLGCLSNES